MIAMKVDVTIEATPNEKRRFLGSPDLTPLVEMISVMLDEAMMVVVDARLEALEAMTFEEDDIDDPTPDQQRRRS